MCIIIDPLLYVSSDGFKNSFEMLSQNSQLWYFLEPNRLHFLNQLIQISLGHNFYGNQKTLRVGLEIKKKYLIVHDFVRSQNIFRGQKKIVLKFKSSKYRAT